MQLQRKHLQCTCHWCSRHCRHRTRFHHPRSSLPSMNHQTPDTCLRPCIRMWLCTSRLHKAMCSRMTSLSRLETSDHFHTHCSVIPCGLTMTGMCRRGTLRTTSRIGVGRLSRWSNSRMALLSRLERPDRSHSCRSQSGRPDRIGQPRTTCSSCATWCPPCLPRTRCRH